VRWLKKALGMTGRKAAEDLCTRGYVAAREGRLDAAQKLYDEACDADPTLAVAWFNAGQTSLERFNRDVATLDAAGRAERLRTAAAHLSRGLDGDANHMPSWRALARVHERLGRLDAAFGAWGRVEACLGMANPDVDGAVGSDLAGARTEARRERARLKTAADLASTTRHVQELIGQDTVDVAVAAAAVEALVAGRATAIAEAASADAADGADGAAVVVVAPFLLTLAGTLARKAGDLARARTLLDSAVVEGPRDLEAWRNLATVCLAQGDIAAALKASQTAYRLDPVDAGLVCNLGVCHLAAVDAGLGSLDEAREYIELAAGLAPKDPIVQRAVAALGARAQTPS